MRNSRFSILLSIILFLPAVFSLSQENDSKRKDSLFVLDQVGKRGIVYFDHASHESLITPDPTYPYKASKEAACAGCHHTVNSSGVIQIVACAACHLEPGNPKNPISNDKVEQSSDEAFHRNCMGCHRATQKGPRLCGGCHKMVPKMSQ